MVSWAHYDTYHHHRRRTLIRRQERANADWPCPKTQGSSSLLCFSLETFCPHTGLATLKRAVLRHAFARHQGQKKPRKRASRCYLSSKGLRLEARLLGVVVKSVTVDQTPNFEFS